jgi:hypothetical protein
MLMVLMALVELGKSKVHSATRWLWLLFSGGLFVAPLACEPGKSSTDDVQPTTDSLPPGDPGPGDVPQVLYGPPPDASVDVPQDLYQGNPDCGPMVAYGPPPCDSDAFCVGTYGEGWYCVKSTDPCGWDTCMPPSQDVDAITPDHVADTSPDCSPLMVAYGPPPCTSDQDCVEWYGAGATCEKSSDPCYGTYCMPAQDVDAITTDTVTDAPPDCGQAVYYGPPPPYGPPPCDTDQDCADWYGAGATCVKSDPCGSAYCQPASEGDIPR